MFHASNPRLARLRKDLLRRRWARLELRLRLELIALALGLAAFTFWQLRIHYAGIAFSHGARGAGVALLATLAGLLVVGGAGTALRLHRRLRAAPEGPAWLALPLPAPDLWRHQAWESELPLRATFVLAAAACIAAARIAAWPIVAGAVVAFPFAWAACCRAGAAIPRAIVARGDSEPALRALLATAWAIRSPSPSRIPSREASWRRRPLIGALVLKDFWLARRSREARLPLLLALGLSVISVGLWNLPALRSGAFAVALLAAAAWGEWLIVLGSRDPFAVLRALPVSPGAVWLSRMAWGATAIVLLVAAHAAAAPGPSGLLRLSLAWLVISGLAIAALAINLQLTLFPHHAPALRLFGLALALALACSLMIPLFGWAVLLASVIHTARRLPRWWRLEEAA